MRKTIIYILSLSFLFSAIYGETFTLSNNHTEFSSDYSVQSRKTGRTGGSRTTRRVEANTDPTSFNNFLYSFILPGFSEYRMGYKKTAMVFWTTEVLLLGSAIILDSYGSSKTTDYKNYAVRHAGISKTGKSDGYWVDLGNYDSRSDYKEAQIQKGNYSIGSGSDDWNWDSSSNRTKYDDLRINAEFAKTLSLYSIGALAINHLTSAITASYLSTNVKIEAKLDSDNFSGINNELKPKVCLSYKF